MLVYQMKEKVFVEYATSILNYIEHSKEATMNRNTCQH